MKKRVLAVVAAIALALVPLTGCSTYHDNCKPPACGGSTRP